MPEKSTTRLPLRVTVAYLAVASLIYVASFYPEKRLWGVNLFGYFGEWGALLFLAVAIGVFLFVYMRPAHDDDVTEGASGKFYLMAVGVTAVLAVCFWVFRGRTHFLGDGAQLASWLEEGIHHKPWEMGTFQIQSMVFALLGGHGKETAELALQLVSIGAGVVSLVATAVAARFLFESNRARLLFFLGLASSGQMLLYFGYFESYPIFVSAFTLFVLAGMLVSRGMISKWWLLPLFVLCGYLHVFAVVLIPSTVYLFLSETAWWKVRVVGKREAVLSIVLIPVVIGIAGIVYLYNASYFFRFVVVPIVNGPLVVEGYTMFSGKHLLDYVNLLLQMLPALPLIVVTLFINPRKPLANRKDFWFLVVLTFPCLMMVFLINPGLGMPRDWDLFAFAGISLSARAFYVLLKADYRRSMVVPVAILSIVLGILVLIPRVAIQAVPEKSIELMDNLSDLDWARNRTARFFVNRYVREYGDSLEYERRSLNTDLRSTEERLAREGVALVNVGKVREAVSKFRQSLAIAPNYAHAWTNLGVAYSELGDLDSALICLQLSDALSSFNATTNFNLGTVQMGRGKWKEAEEYLKKAIELKDDHFSARWRLMQLYRQLGREKEFSDILSETGSREDAPLDFVRALADHDVKSGKIDEAERLYHRALNMGMDSAIIREIQRQFPELHVIDTTGE